MSTSTCIAWKGIGASVRGASHIRAGSLCQDAIAIIPGDNSGETPLIAAVADGHGSEKCFRSDIGAQLAVDIARSGLTLFSKRANQQFGAFADEVEAIRTLTYDAQQHMPVYVETQWKKKVDEHLLAHPFSEAERALLAKSKETHYLAYGSTLVAVLATSRLLLHLQIGDGDTLVLEGDDQVSAPLPNDPLLEGNQTTSLCLPKSQQYVRIVLRPLRGVVPQIIMLSTDGYANSYDSDEFLERVREYYNLVAQFGADAIQAKLPGWLSDVSDKGSGDDISLALIFPGKGLLPHPAPPARDVGHSAGETAGKSPSPQTALTDQRDRETSDRKRQLLLWVCIILAGTVVASAGWALALPRLRPLIGDTIGWILHGAQPQAPKPPAPNPILPVESLPEPAKPSDAQPQPPSDPMPVPPTAPLPSNDPVRVPAISVDPTQHTDVPQKSRTTNVMQHLSAHRAKASRKPPVVAAQLSSATDKKKSLSERQAGQLGTERKDSSA